LNFFRYLLRLRRYKRKSVEARVFEGGGPLSANISEGRRRRPLNIVSVGKIE